MFSFCVRTNDEPYLNIFNRSHITKNLPLHYLSIIRYSIPFRRYSTFTVFVASFCLLKWRISRALWNLYCGVNSMISMLCVLLMTHLGGAGHGGARPAGSTVAPGRRSRSQPAPPPKRPTARRTSIAHPSSSSRLTLPAHPKHTQLGVRHRNSF